MQNLLNLCEQEVVDVLEEELLDLNGLFGDVLLTLFVFSDGREDLRSDHICCMEAERLNFGILVLFTEHIDEIVFIEKLEVI